MKQESFLKINYQLLTEGYSLYQVIIISYLKSFQEQNKYCFQSQNQIANLFKIPISSFKNEIKILKEKGIIFTSQDKKYLKAAFNNRKALILVDDKNPLPIIEKVIATTAETFTGQTENTQIVSVIKKVVEDLPQAKEIVEEVIIPQPIAESSAEQIQPVEEVIIPQLEPRICLPKDMQHLNLTSTFWDEENIQWLIKYKEAGYKVEDVPEANLKIRVESFAERILS